MNETSATRSPRDVAQLALVSLAVACAATLLSAANAAQAPEPAGDGLRASYYGNAELVGNATVRVDAAVDFHWVGEEPALGIGAGPFGVRWTGQIEPEFTETYTFYARVNHGVRLWVDGHVLIDRLVNQDLDEWSGTIALQAGRRYDVKLEYRADASDAVAQLLWSSPSTPKDIVPRQRLYSLLSEPIDASLRVSGIS